MESDRPGETSPEKDFVVTEVSTSSTAVTANSPSQNSKSFHLDDQNDSMELRNP